ncbi:MAG TPA: flotillin domain-containing protein, partial [Rhodoblastus sp.]|nr:flotillin domain-containing protein [Rhodoblastus sp.]
VSFVQKVQAAVSEDILKNGLELESVSLTGLDQTGREYFNPDNAFDAEGLTRLTQAIQSRRKLRNDIEQETEVEIQMKNLDAEARRLTIARDVEYARLEQEREVEVRRAGQLALIARERADREREAEEAKISATQKVKEAGILSDRAVAERDIDKERAVEAARVEKVKLIALAQQDSDILVAEKSRAKSEAEAVADEARAIAAKAAEAVATARETEVAERLKAIELIEARKAAEQQAIAIKVAAEAEKAAATDHAEAVRIAAEADAARERIIAEGGAEAEKLRAAALRQVYDAEAEGQRKVNEAANLLSAEQIAMQIRKALIEALPKIIEQSVKPMEAIDGIKILHVEGLSGPGGGASTSSSTGLADQAVNAALRYRAQAPLLDALMGELGLKGATLDGLTGGVANGPDDKPSE